ncbi:GTPase HflX [Devosia sp.]|uniref:GTPase HflX n=1 Tax=Devosia sp. TaxID=1871048 RepID=UPI003266787C
MTDFEDDEDRRGGPQAFIDRRQEAARVGLVCPDVRGLISRHDAEARLAEFVGLAGAIEFDIAFAEIIKVREVKPATFIGGGNVETLKERVKTDDIDVLLIDAALTAIQQRNLETETGAKVLDRTGLILEIFGERAATREGVLQVELAHLKYQKGRLVRSWTHLERQRGSGGYGFMGGPGETQIESDRRQIMDRIVLLEDRLEKVKKTRAQQRRQREDNLFMVALVGYTNAGKSSLFNTMTGAGVYVENLLFATLDTTIRKIELPHGREVMLSDTVGFVSDLPTDLVAAFRATLEEVAEADVILHVRDVANPDHIAQAHDVLKVLGDLGVSAETTPIIEVWNKVDLLPRGAEGHPALETVTPIGKVAGTVPVSAKTGEGLEALKLAIEAALAGKSRSYHVHVPHSAGADIGWLHSHTEIISRDEPDENGSGYVVRVETRQVTAFLERFNGRFDIVAG